ncbi:RNHCP domain-containing protein [Proteinivorax hydrogeniformans]|uniref:RNHCP domain-containing protein n=1 Tax=Proteinivorax hydrogeniformans TaxID=1826727 RepID=A0AAU8HSJ5_9FIRM
MSRKIENTGFLCENCSEIVLQLTNGSYRNHCPFCLFSKHVDENPGDRKSQCNALMQPICITYNPKKGYQITHRCTVCGKEQKNKAAQDTVQPDDLNQLMGLVSN